MMADDIWKVLTKTFHDDIWAGHTFTSKAKECHQCQTFAAIATAHDAQVAARALREAADGWPASGWSQAAVDWLNYRADAIYPEPEVES